MLILCITKEFIVINDETIINITFLTLTIIIVYYGSSLVNVFIDLRKSIKTQLQTNSNITRALEAAFCDRSLLLQESLVKLDTQRDNDVL